MLDTPGGFDFSGEVMQALTVADAAIIVCSAKDGISVGLETVSYTHLDVYKRQAHHQQVLPGGVHLPNAGDQLIHHIVVPPLVHPHPVVGLSLIHI